MKKVLFVLTTMIFFFPVHMCFADASRPAIGYSIEEINERHCKANYIDMKKAQNFLDQFNEFVRVDNRKAIAKMVQYPVKIYKRTKKTQIYYYIYNEKDFLGQYCALFNERTKKLLAKHHKVDCASLGAVSTAFGTFYFDYSDDDIKIISISTN